MSDNSINLPAATRTDNVPSSAPTPAAPERAPQSSEPLPPNKGDVAAHAALSHEQSHRAAQLKDVVLRRAAEIVPSPNAESASPLLPFTKAARDVLPPLVKPHTDDKLTNKRLTDTRLTDTQPTDTGLIDKSGKRQNYKPYLNDESHLNDKTHLGKPQLNDKPYAAALSLLNDVRQAKDLSPAVQRSLQFAADALRSTPDDAKLFDRFVADAPRPSHDVLLPTYKSVRPADVAEAFMQRVVTALKALSAQASTDPARYVPTNNLPSSKLTTEIVNTVRLAAHFDKLERTGGEIVRRAEAALVKLLLGETETPLHAAPRVSVSSDKQKSEASVKQSFDLQQTPVTTTASYTDTKRSRTETQIHSENSTTASFSDAKKTSGSAKSFDAFPPTASSNTASSNTASAPVTSLTTAWLNATSPNITSSTTESSATESSTISSSPTVASSTTTSSTIASSTTRPQITATELLRDLRSGAFVVSDARSSMLTGRARVASEMMELMHLLDRLEQTAPQKPPLPAPATRAGEFGVETEAAMVETLSPQTSSLETSTPPNPSLENLLREDSLLEDLSLEDLTLEKFSAPKLPGTAAREHLPGLLEAFTDKDRILRDTDGNALFIARDGTPYKLDELVWSAVDVTRAEDLNASDFVEVSPLLLYGYDALYSLVGFDGRTLAAPAFLGVKAEANNSEPSTLFTAPAFGEAWLRAVIERLKDDALAHHNALGAMLEESLFYGNFHQAMLRGKVEGGEVVKESFVLSPAFA